MSASIIEKPFFFDFAHNAVNFKLGGTPISVTGRKAVTRYKISVMPRTNYLLILRYGTKIYNFLVKQSSSASTNPNEIYPYTVSGQIKSELEKKIAQNYYISRDFEVTVSDTLEITFSAKQNGGDNVILQSNDSYANIQLLSQITGVERVEKNGYKPIFENTDERGIGTHSIWTFLFNSFF